MAAKEPLSANVKIRENRTNHLSGRLLDVILTKIDPFVGHEALEMIYTDTHTRKQKHKLTDTLGRSQRIQSN